MTEWGIEELTSRDLGASATTSADEYRERGDASDHSDTSCADYTRLSRRGLIAGLGALGGATMMFGSTAVQFAAPAAAAAPASALGSSVLVVLSLRGAADGLSLVVPHNDPVYYAARPNIAIPRTELLAADSTFGLHPQLAPLMPMWQAGQVAAIHGTGMAIPNRSHFAAIELVEDAAPGSATRTGWLNRLIGTDQITHPLQGLAVGGTPPASLAGNQPFMAISSLTAGIAGDDASSSNRRRLKALHSIWDSQTTPMGNAWRTTMNADAGLAGARSAADQRTLYPSGPLGSAFATVARVIRGNVGAGVITIDHGSWDFHTALGTATQGPMVNAAGQFAKATAAFFNDLGAARSRVTVVVLSEFGRRVQENASRGLDHGWGNVMWAIGAGVRGGYYGQVQPLSNALDADVQVVLDYRSVLAEVVTRRTAASAATVFPGFKPEPVGFMA